MGIEGEEVITENVCVEVSLRRRIDSRGGGGGFCWDTK